MVVFGGHSSLGQSDGSWIIGSSSELFVEYSQEAKNIAGLGSRKTVLSALGMSSTSSLLFILFS